MYCESLRSYQGPRPSQATCGPWSRYTNTHHVAVGDLELQSHPSAADTETFLTLLIKGATAVLSSNQGGGRGANGTFGDQA